MTSKTFVEYSVQMDRLYSLLREIGFVENSDNNFEIVVTDENIKEVQGIYDFICQLADQQYRIVTIGDTVSANFGDLKEDIS